MMPRFVVLDHDWPHPHRDLLLEREGVLRAWRLPPVFDLTAPVHATLNADHRLAYLDYEGPVSGDRGQVRRWDTGELIWVSFAETDLRVQLNGVHLHGQFRLTQVNGGWVLSREASSPRPNE